VRTRHHRDNALKDSYLSIALLQYRIVRGGNGEIVVIDDGGDLRKTFVSDRVDRVDIPPRDEPDTDRVDPEKVPNEHEIAERCWDVRHGEGEIPQKCRASGDARASNVERT